MMIGSKDISMHGLRHTHSSLLISKVVDVAYVSERLGHNATLVTMKTYLSLPRN
ncbi:tyrosine-type recombinase/integrase [Weissella confusa]|uniref:tyrosine-type recombinase/integrase n=1 Tax=Weissella confusa TaxID=1583 RepID=UPI0035A37AE6